MLMRTSQKCCSSLLAFSREMGRLLYLVRKEKSVFVEYIDDTKFVHQRMNVPFGAMYNIVKS